MRYYPHPFSVDETDAWIAWCVDSYAAHGFGLWGLELVGTAELVGDCGLVMQEVDGHELVEIGWHVRRDLWGQGIATEAARACRDHAFETVGRGEVISLVRPENLASCRVAEKIGMTVWKTIPRGSQGWRHRVYRLDRSDAGRPPT